MTTPHPPAGTPSDTPETDKQCDKPFVRWFESWSQMLEHARTLERSRDTALAELAKWKDTTFKADERIKELFGENAQLRADLAAARKDYDELRAELFRIHTQRQEVMAAFALSKDEITALAARADAAESAISDLMPFVLDDYMPDFAVPHFKVAVETAQAIAERFDAARDRIGG